MNTAIWELILSAVLLLELPALVSAALLLMRAKKADPKPTRKQQGIAVGIGLTIPWAGGLIGLVLGGVLSLATDNVVLPLILSTILSVLALQYWWTRLVLGEWTVDPTDSPMKIEESSEESEGTSP